MTTPNRADSKRTSRRRASRHAGLNRFLLQALVRLYPPTALAVGAPATDCLRILLDSARPTMTKLHLRDLFADGRRYYIQRAAQGFRLTSDNSPLWARRRQRTRVTAYIVGTFSHLQTDTHVTLIRLHAHMYRLYFLRSLLLPTFFGALIAYLPWTLLTKAVIVGLVYSLSILVHRLNAAIQVNEMIYFVQKVFADLPPVVMRELPARNPDVVYGNDDFAAEWARFYREQSDEDRA
ncbi:MAG: hypothetical protein SGJ24_01440 [Chloroflexota bacterium]|nr:hypothetical protein [Chloroflexota bacterium]